MLGWLRDSSAKRAENVNRFRRNKTVRPGDEVVVRDPRQRKAGGRTPYKQPYTDPALVLEVHGNKCTLKTKDGTVLKDIHLEDVLQVPENARNLEKEPLHFEDEDEKFLYLDNIDTRRSPGMMLEDRGKSVEAHAQQFKEARRSVSTGKLDKIQSGNFVVYVLPYRRKEVTAVSYTHLTLPTIYSV